MKLVLTYPQFGLSYMYVSLQSLLNPSSKGIQKGGE